MSERFCCDRAGAYVVAGVLFGVVLQAACGRVGGSDPHAVTVFAAISVTEPLERLAAHFKAATSVTVTLNLSGSRTLATGILSGAPADVFLSADEVEMDRLSSAGRIVQGTRRRLLSNRLVVIVPAASTLAFEVPADLAGPAVTRFAIGNPEAVPAGRYAAAYLRARGVWPQIEHRLVFFPHVRATAAAVEQGAAQAGIVYRTDARATHGVRVLLEIDEDPRWTITYPAAVVTRAPHLESARRFLAFLEQPDSRRVFEEAGFVTLQTQAPAASQ
jgi:molybdate transport system substrate-binding protein